jgi:hypothetical protein
VCGVAAAEPIPTFSYSKRLQAPLAPRTLNLQQQQMVTLHMHCFQYSQQQHEQGSSGSSGVLYLAVGAPLRCKAIPGNAAAAPAFAGSSSGSRSSFGVLTWQPLPGAIGRDDAAAADNSSSSDSVASLQFPAWLSAEEQEPSTVSIRWLLLPLCTDRGPSPTSGPCQLSASMSHRDSDPGHSHI